ncbi:MAG: SLATT domain-containing protein [Akkermansia sp.]
MDQDSQINNIEDQIRQSFCCVVYTHKAHEKFADSLDKKHKKNKLLQIIFSSATASGVLLTVLNVFQGYCWFQISIKVATSLLSFGTIFVSSFLKDFNILGESENHKHVATILIEIRDKYISLLVNIRNKSIDLLDIKRERDLIQKSLEIVYTLSPRTNSTAYDEAREALQKNEEYTFSDEEIDRLLPKSLRKKTRAEQIIESERREQSIPPQTDADGNEIQVSN